MSFGWIVILVLGMFYIGIVIPNNQKVQMVDRLLTTVDKAIDAGLMTKEEFDESLKEITKELGAKSGTTGAKE